MEKLKYMPVLNNEFLKVDLREVFPISYFVKILLLIANKAKKKQF